MNPRSTLMPGYEAGRVIPFLLPILVSVCIRYGHHYIYYPYPS